MVDQGDIIKAEGISFLLVVISKDTYNQTGHALVCPIVDTPSDSPFTFDIDLPGVSGQVWYDQLRNIDLDARGYSVQDHMPLAMTLQLVDRIQALIDYI